MQEMTPPALHNRRILIVEDEYLIATDLADLLAEHGATVVGPAGNVQEALALVDREGAKLDGAVLDINLRGERSFPIADRLLALGVRPIFTTGYSDPGAMPHAELPRLTKPIDSTHLLLLLSTTTRQRAG
jgi:CheY-like chemotaxis protein